MSEHKGCMYHQDKELSVLKIMDLNVPWKYYYYPGSKIALGTYPGSKVALGTYVGSRIALGTYTGSKVPLGPYLGSNV